MKRLLEATGTGSIKSIGLPAGAARGRPALICISAVPASGPRAQERQPQAVEPIRPRRCEGSVALRKDSNVILSSDAKPSAWRLPPKSAPLNEHRESRFDTNRRVHLEQEIQGFALDAADSATTFAVSVAGRAQTRRQVYQGKSV